MSEDVLEKKKDAEAQSLGALRQELNALVQEADATEIRTIIKHWRQIKAKETLPIQTDSDSECAAEGSSLSYASQLEAYLGTMLGDSEQKAEKIGIVVRGAEGEENDIEIIVPGIAPDNYEYFLTNSLMMGRPTGYIKESIEGNEAIPHEAQAILLLCKGSNRSDWLRAEIAYHVDNNEGTAVIKLSGKKTKDTSRYTLDKGQQLIACLLNYYDFQYHQTRVSIDLGVEIDEEADEEVGLEGAIALGSESDASADGEAQVKISGKEKVDEIAQLEMGVQQIALDVEACNTASVGTQTDMHITNVEKRRSSSFSSSSGALIGEVEQLDAPFIRARVNEEGNIIVSIGGKRAKTKFGRKQAEHVTAYTLFIQFVLNAVDGIPIAEIPLLLMQSAKCFLPEDEHGHLKTVYDVYQEKATKESFMTRERRKAFTREMRQNGHPEGEVSRVKTDIKRSYSMFIADLVTAMSSHIISSANREENATFLGVVGKTPSELGVEGNRVRNAIQALKALDKLLALDQATKQNGAPEKQAKLRADLTEIKSLSDGLKQFKGEEFKALRKELLLLQGTAERPSTAELISIVGSRRITRSAANVGKSEEGTTPASLSIIEEAVKFMVALFDFDYHKRLAAEMFKFFKGKRKGAAPLINAYIKKKKASDESVDYIALVEAMKLIIVNGLSLAKKEAKSAQVEGEVTLIESLMKKVRLSANELGKELGEKEDLLLDTFKEVCNTHMGFIFTAFRQLTMIDGEGISSIIVRFIDQLMLEQGWQDHPKVKVEKIGNSVNEHISTVLFSENNPTSLRATTDAAAAAQAPLLRPGLRN